MEYAEDDYLMLSGIQHFKFCRRQWALIHIEQQWAENVHTVVGELMHKKAHDPYLVEKRKDLLLSLIHILDVGKVHYLIYCLDLKENIWVKFW